MSGTSGRNPWLRPWRSRSSRAAITYIWTIAVAQVLWVALAIAALPIGPTLALFAVFIGVEMIGPFMAERRKGGTPWHAHHIAERYGLLVIITLGEGIIGTARHADPFHLALLAAPRPFSCSPSRSPRSVSDSPRACW